MLFLIFAAMKRPLIIGLALLLAWAACHRAAEAPEPAVSELAVREAHRRVEGLSPVLSALDSLMWQQPDSALAVLWDYLDDDGRDTARYVSTNETFDNHYAHLLTAELLYKNDYAQTNRAELQQAVAYFDSLIRPTPPFKWAGGIKKDLTPNLVFLDARAHYIDGVGYYEHDSVVEACAEYLKALETMEGRFDEKALTGHRARFMAYTFNRLGELFSGQFMMESAIDCYGKSVVFSKIEPTSIYGIANAYYRMGTQFDALEKKDTAFVYYRLALNALPDTNNSYYRDILSSMAFLDYQLTNDQGKAIDKLHHVAMQAIDEAEKNTRYMVIGSIYFMEQEYDAALPYLDSAYRASKDVAVQIQMAESLRDVYRNIGNEGKAEEYANFLSQYAVSNYEQKTAQSQLSNLYQNYHQRKAKIQNELEKARLRQRFFLFSVLLVLLFVAVTVLLLRRRHKIRIRATEEMLKSEGMLHAAELNDLRDINNQLQNENQKLAKQQESMHAKAKEKEYEALLNEEICMDLLQRFGKTDILTTIKPEEYAALSITPKEKQALAKAVMRHCPGFDSIIKAKYPTIRIADIDVCRFYLIGLSEQQIAVLLQKDYSTIWKRTKRLKEMMNCVEPRMHLRRLLFELEAQE